MNKKDLINAISLNAKTSKAVASRVLDALIDQVQKSVSAGEEVKITGFGKFERASIAAREGRNPRTGTTVKIPAVKRPRFVPGTFFKNQVKG